MRGFIVLCLVATACAQYNYNPSQGGSGLLSGGISGGSLGGSLGGGSLGIGSLGGGSLGGGSLGGGSLGGGSLGGGSLGGGSLGGGSLGGGSRGGSSGLSSGPAEFSKEFYTYSANDQEFDEPEANEQIANSVKKSLRVIFIKGPENKGLEDAAIALAKSASEDKTAIYVLSKQSDIGSLADQISQLRAQSQNKPEVHFVKYRTPEDAANAQNAIRQQYEQLGGSSQAHDGGNAPVINFASPQQIRGPAAPKQPNNAYLPSSIIRLVRK